MLLALLLLAAAPASSSLDALVARVAEAYGGEKAVARAGTLRQKGTVQTPRGPAKTLRVLAAPGRLRVEVAYESGAKEVRVLDDSAAYRNGEKVAGPPRDAMALQAARLELPALLWRPGAKLTDLGLLERDGQKLRCIGLALADSLALAVCVDPASARIVRSEGALPGGPAGQMRFATVYSDFRPVAGVLFAFHEANFAGGQRTGETQLDLVELLAEPPAGAFAP